MFKYLQKIGKPFMLPIAILPAADLLLGIGGAFSSAATIAAYPFLDVPFLQAIFKIMNAAGNVAFANLSLLLCIGICVGLANKDKGTAALAGVVGTIFYIVWPPLQNLLVVAGQAIAGAAVIGTFFYGFLMRLCGAVGLHHMIYPMFWYTELGGVEMVAGAQNIFFAQLADPTHKASSQKVLISSQEDSIQ